MKANGFGMVQGYNGLAHMEQMNLRDWSNLSVEQRKTWLNAQTPKSLVNLLVMIGEMLNQADEMDAELRMLIEPDQSVLDARNFTHSTLRDVETHVTHAIRDRNILMEQTV